MKHQPPVLHDLVPFDPEHLPQEKHLIEAFHQWPPDLVQVACFDTAFHRDLARVARRAIDSLTTDPGCSAGLRPALAGVS